MQQQAKNTLVGKRYKLRNEDNNKLNMMITAAVIYISNDSNVMEVYKPVQFVNDGFKKNVCVCVCVCVCVFLFIYI